MIGPVSAVILERLILDSVPALVSTITPAGEIDFANQQLLAYLGVGLDALRDWPAFVHESGLGPHSVAESAVGCC